MVNVLIIEDEPIVNHLLASMVRRLGHEVSTAFLLQEGMEKAAQGGFDAILLDVLLPDGNGLDALPDLARGPSSPEVIIITGADLDNGAELAFRSGAWDYLEKPVTQASLSLTLNRALHFRAEKAENKKTFLLKRDRIIGDSAPMRACLEMVGRAAMSEAGVLITGETGAGKKLLARAVHENGPRAHGNFVVTDCASLPPNLVDGILFGYENSAPAGIHQSHTGLIKKANGGTLYLDEVGELPINVQSSFLYALQEQHYYPIGSQKPDYSDFRVLAATNRDLEKMCREGGFRGDLLFRLRTHLIEIPPLRKRRDDIKDLVIYWLAILCERYGLEQKGFSPGFFDPLQEYDWPGNVRELINSLERTLFNVGAGPTLYPQHLPAAIRAHYSRTTAAHPPKTEAEANNELTTATLPTLPEYRQLIVSQAEKKYLEDLMVQTGGRIKDAALVAGLSEPRLYSLLKKYKIKRVKTH